MPDIKEIIAELDRLRNVSQNSPSPPGTVNTYRLNYEDAIEAAYPALREAALNYEKLRRAHEGQLKTEIDWRNELRTRVTELQRAVRWLVNSNGGPWF